MGREFMNEVNIKDNLKILKGKIKQQWGKVTDDEITQIKGSYEELSGVLQKKYGYDKVIAEKQIKEFIKKNKCE
jgi:uncharacterized protein YjbJ (UPF0337 family)